PLPAGAGGIFLLLWQRAAISPAGAGPPERSFPPVCCPAFHPAAKYGILVLTAAPVQDGPGREKKGLYTMAKRVFLIVLDSFGIGAEPDAAAFGDEGTNTLGAIARHPAFDCPNMGRLGLFNIDGVT